MSGLQGVSVTLCFTCVAVSIASLLIPQKRTRKIMGFVIGLFFISTLVTTLYTQAMEFGADSLSVSEIEIPSYSEEDYNDAVAQETADNLTKALNELMINDGIRVNDIQLSLKISDEGRISVVRAVIYINEEERSKMKIIESIVYRNIAKEPEVYVQGEETQ